MSLNLDRLLEEARALADDLERSGQHYGARIIRQLATSRAHSRQTNSRLHGDNRDLRCDLARLKDHETDLVNEVDSLRRALEEAARLARHVWFNDQLARQIEAMQEQRKAGGKG